MSAIQPVLERLLPWLGWEASRIQSGESENVGINVVRDIVEQASCSVTFHLSLWDLFTCDEMILGLATGSHLNHRSDFFLQPILVTSLDSQNELAYHYSWPPRLDPHKGKSFSHVSCMPQALLLELRGIETNPLLTTFDAQFLTHSVKNYPCDLGKNSFHASIHLQTPNYSREPT